MVNFWSNGCGSCIAEMPDLEEYYIDVKDKDVNFIGVGVDSGDSDKHMETAQDIIREKGVTYMNIAPTQDGSFLNHYIENNILGYPSTVLVDSDGNIIGAQIYGVIKPQEDMFLQRIDEILVDSY